MSSQPQYEFTQEQNSLLGSLAGKMRFVGLFAVILGVVNLIMAILVVVAIYRGHIPQDWKDYIEKNVEVAKEKLPADVKEKSDQYKLDKLPTNNYLWGIALNAGVIGLFYVLMGVWTRSAGASFQKIVDTRGNDISNLMNGMASLHSMYSLIYMLLVITLIMGLIGIGLTIWQSFAR